MKNVSAVPAKKPTQAKPCKKKGASKHRTPAEIIQKIISLSVTTLDLMPLLSDGDDANAIMMLDTLIKEISSVTGTKLSPVCPIETGTDAPCGFALKVVAELEPMSRAANTCIQIIDAAVDKKNYVYGLTAARELLESIIGSTNELCEFASEHKKTGPDDETPLPAFSAAHPGETE